MNIFTHSHVLPNPYDTISAVEREHTKRYFGFVVPGCIFHTITMNEGYNFQASKKQHECILKAVALELPNNVYKSSEQLCEMNSPDI